MVMMITAMMIMMIDGDDYDVDDYDECMFHFKEFFIGETHDWICFGTRCCCACIWNTNAHASLPGCPRLMGNYFQSLVSPVSARIW